MLSVQLNLRRQLCPWTGANLLGMNTECIKGIGKNILQRGWGTACPALGRTAFATSVLGDEQPSGGMVDPQVERCVETE